MSNAAFHFVPTELTHLVWHGVKPLIDKTQNRPDDCLNTDDFHEMISRGDVRLVIGLDEVFNGDYASLNSDAIESVVVCEISEWPRFKVLDIHIWATVSGTDYQKWYDQFYTVENYGRANGCCAVAAVVRKGLAKKLIQISGWKEESILVSKNL
tara:strand:- start:418 stop:879 length:462 start_codon:yes stop_codon:yes gene_type:complete